MCINVVRPRPRPFKFGWVSISLCYAKISIFCPASSAHFPSSNVISSWSISSVCVYVLWVYNGAPQPCFFTLYGRLHTDDIPDDDHFCFPFYMGSCTRRLNLLPIFNRKDLSDFNENQPKHQNRNFLKTFRNYLWWNLFTTFI